MRGLAVLCMLCALSVCVCVGGGGALFITNSESVLIEVCIDA